MSVYAVIGSPKERVMRWQQCDNWKHAFRFFDERLFETAKTAGYYPAMVVLPERVAEMCSVHGEQGYKLDENVPGPPPGRLDVFKDVTATVAFPIELARNEHVHNADTFSRLEERLDWLYADPESGIQLNDVAIFCYVEQQPMKAVVVQVVAQIIGGLFSVPEPKNKGTQYKWDFFSGN